MQQLRIETLSRWSDMGLVDRQKGCPVSKGRPVLVLQPHCMEPLELRLSLHGLLAGDT